MYDTKNYNIQITLPDGRNVLYSIQSASMHQAIDRVYTMHKKFLGTSIEQQDRAKYKHLKLRGNGGTWIYYRNTWQVTPPTKGADIWLNNLLPIKDHYKASKAQDRKLNERDINIITAVIKLKLLRSEGLINTKEYTEKMREVLNVAEKKVLIK